MTQLNGKINVEDFNFDLPQKVRHGGSRKTMHEFDGYLTIGIKGHNRKTNNHTLAFTNFMAKHNFDFKRVSIGTHRTKRTYTVLAFDTNKPAVSINHFKGKRGNGDQWVVNSANFCLRLFELLGIDPPEKPDTSMKLLFDLIELPNNPGYYVLEPLSVTSFDAAGQSKTTHYKKKELA